MIFIDSNIFMYAAGASSPQKEPCKAFLQKLIKSGSATEFYTSVEVLQELLHRYRSVGAPEKAFTLIELILKLGVIVLPVEVEDILLAKRLLEDHSELSTRDGVHVAVAIRKNITKILSYDKDFDLVDRIKRIQP